MMNLVLKDFVSIKDAALRMGLSYSQILSYIRKGVFPSAIKIRGTRWHIHTKDIEDFLLGKISIDGTFKGGKK